MRSMRSLRALLAAIAGACLLTGAIVACGAGKPAALAQRYGEAGPHAVAVLDATWTDPARRREMPVRIHYPRTDKGAWPVVIFSHGLGASHRQYDFLGRHWASHGYASVHPAHKGTDLETFRESRFPVADVFRALSVKAVADRILDVRFAIDRLEQMTRGEAPLDGRLDLRRIGVAGHSYGALTTLLATGQAFRDGNGGWRSLPDPRIKAAIEMSAPLINRRGEYAQAFGPITAPMLHLTGTLDSIFFSAPGDRRVPFDFSRAPDQYLLTLEGADHVTFAGVPRFDAAARERDAGHQSAIRMSTVAFWDAYLRDDRRARRWLANGAFAQSMGAQGKLELRKE